MKKSINLSANGKLLLTGEYLVLVGAKALAFPVRFGQSMQVMPNDRHHIHWVSKENGMTWFNSDLDLKSLDIISTSDQMIALRLVNLLLSAKKINPEFLCGSPGFTITVEANYPLKWGLGSSSTLIALVVEWAKVDKFKLFRMISEGSGYDIACTDRNSIFFYQLNNGEVLINEAQPGKAILDHTCFAYLGKKQESAEEVSDFLSRRYFNQADIERISELSSQICEADDPGSLCSLVDEHEEILSRILKKERIAKRFRGFPGSVKSLGAWGGDFAMFVSAMRNQDIKIWLKQIGLLDVFTYDELRVTI